jgi:hypothetical protein
MASVYRVTAVWSGFTGAPGYTKFAFADLVDTASRNAAGAKVRALFNDLASHRAIGWSVSVNSAVEEFDMATGALIGTVNMTSPPAASNGAATLVAYAGGAGYCVTWNTGVILNRRRIRGRSFFVPAIGCYENDGTLAPAAITAINSACTTFLALSAPRPNVWSRQWSSGSPPVQVGGALAPIDSFSLRDSTAQLRSRRL